MQDDRELEKMYNFKKYPINQLDGVAESNFELLPALH